MAQQISKKFFKDGSVDGSKIKLLKDQSIKGQDQSGQEVDLVKLDSSDKVLLKGQEAAIKSEVNSAIASESSRAQGEESRIEGKVDAETSARQSAISSVESSLASEVSSRQSGDVQTLVDAKAYADQKMTELMGGVTPQQLDTIKEIAEAIQSDESAIGSITSQISQISSELSSEVSARQSAISSEAAARQAADDALSAQLQSAISSAVSSSGQSAAADLASEVSRAQSAESVLDGKITSETSRAQSAESVLDGKIETEKTRAMGVESSLSSSISSESSARVAGDASTLSSAQAYADTKKSELKTYSDNTFQTKAAALSGKTALETSIANEVSRAQSAESSISSSLSSEVSRAQGEESRIEGKVDSEILNRQSDVTAKLVEAKSYADSVGASKLVESKSYTDGKISDLIGGAPAMMDTLKEISDAIANDESVATALASTVASEVSRAQAAESVLDGKITTEKNRAESAEAALSSDAVSKLAEAKSYADTKKSEAQSYADSAVLVEKNRAESSESSITSSLNSEISRAQTEEGTLVKLDGSRPMTGILNMGSHKITGLVTPTSNSDAAGKGYVDGQVSAEATARASAVSTVQSNLNSEISRAQSAESVLSGRVTIVETDVAALKAISFVEFKKVLDATDISNGFVTLPHNALAGGFQAFADRLALHNGVSEDYTISTVSGVTRVTFHNDVISSGVQSFSEGDNLYFRYRVASL